MIRKLLIANRGEIVARVIRTCRRLGIGTVAVYSDADSGFSYLKEADESHRIGPSNPIKSYLNMEAILGAVEASGADAVHPGYGFLSENSLFAEAVVGRGATWVGPPPAILKAIDSKSYCRKIAGEAGVPFVPGTVGTVGKSDEILRFASEAGYPVVLKLDMGGGGKGIEQVDREDQVKEAFERLSRIGLMAFGHPECYVEKRIVNPRHIEIQFLADGGGRCICLGERECSIQRRYQKIIEESPSPAVTEAEREELFRHTFNLVKAMGYVGAGTMEFLRSEDRRYYFMEVNARLQVEHPVTEFLTGMDIVESQLRIAAGEPLRIGQEDVKFDGHAIEARVYAEDPVSFCPSPGTITRLQLPGTDEGRLRIDHALEEGAAVPPYYDPLLAKVIAWGETREAAVLRLKKGLSDFSIEGIKSTIPANLLILSSREFAEGNIHTGFIGEIFSRDLRTDDAGNPLWPCM